MERKFRITVNGRAYDVTVEDLTDGAGRLLPQPGDMRVPAPPQAPIAETPQSDEGPGAGDLPSPLAGLVHSVEVSVGDAVEQGQALVVIESMKMKTTIVAKRSGTVSRVLVKPGDSVDGGETLLSIE